ncbi:hypothetical protein HJC23_003716 [Cyclotella cryptica]|uniref:Tr-type G domain-containing protein n=1 Tax=Cyclotella cryptica TaxID=29204 RepID=A0ABD3QU17_9STRA|eukprot:CCRYP_002114-RA/>CCRYP_002114-RA protein AED:0.04 eAED:0.04 QI:449/1/1/1/0.75/0.6/5/1094/838
MIFHQRALSNILIRSQQINRCHDVVRCLSSSSCFSLDRHFSAAATSSSSSCRGSKWNRSILTTTGFTTQSNEIITSTNSPQNQRHHRTPFIQHAASFSTSSALENDEDPASSNATNAARPYSIRRRSGVRNVAIVAHVDHGKTTLVDELLKVASSSSSTAATTTTTAADSSSESTDQETTTNLNRLMDSGELEKERGITITSKVTRLDYTSPSTSSTSTTTTVINVVDTPGHADFAGEVDRILTTVDGIVLVVDAGEGPKSQTKYVLGRALSLGLVPIVILNKADRVESLGRLESGETELELMDLFEALGAMGAQMEYRTLFGSARGGWVTEDVGVALEMAEGAGGGERRSAVEGVMSMRGLLDAILEDIPAPAVHWYGGDNNEERDGTEEEEEEAEKRLEDLEGQPFSMTATTVGYDNFLGRTCTGRIYSGKVQAGDSITLLRQRSTETSDQDNLTNGPTTQISGVFANRGVSRMPLDPPVAYAGDIVTLTGVPESLKVGDTLTSAGNRVPMAVETPPLAPPTLSCLFGANNGPLAGKEGTIVTSSKVRDRLIKETDNNVTLTVEKCESDAEKTVVLGRGELQIGILVEQMRREGYEMIITPPQILTKTCPDTGMKLEPYEEVVIDVDAEYSGSVVNALTGARKGVLVEMMDDKQGKTRMKFEVPSRGLLGFGPEIATFTRGTAVMHHCYLEDREYAGNMSIGSDKGKLVANDSGKATLFALEALSARGTLFVAPGDMVYPGMVVGENNKSGDLEVNPVRAKATSNMRTQSKDEKLYLAPPKRMSVEELIGYMSEDEVIEVTPQSVRLRKAELDAGVRERAARTKKKQLESLKAIKK